MACTAHFHRHNILYGNCNFQSTTVIKIEDRENARLAHAFYESAAIRKISIPIAPRFFLQAHPGAFSGPL